ncbi:hypothetical protein RUND412_011599 [Rhizina undulata]
MASISSTAQDELKDTSCLPPPLSTLSAKNLATVKSNAPCLPNAAFVPSFILPPTTAVPMLNAKVAKAHPALMLLLAAPTMAKAILLTIVLASMWSWAVMLMVKITPIIWE